MALLISVVLAGCGGGVGGGTSGDAAGGATTGVTTATEELRPAPQPPAAPAAPTDAAIRNLLAQANVAPLAAPATDANKVALGRALMFDKILSGNRNVSCATCHHTTFHTGDALSLSIGVGGIGLGPTRVQGVGQRGQGTLPFIARNAPDVFNRGQAQWRTMFWDSRVSGAPGNFTTPAGNQLPAGLDNVLAVQAMFPVTSRAEMRGEDGDRDVFGNVNELAQIADNNLPAIWAALTARLLANAEYRALFAAAYPTVPTNQLGFQHAANAIAAFEIASFTGFNSPFDRYVAGDNNVLNAAEKRGAGQFFGAARCSQCHNGSLLTDQNVHNIGTPQIGPGHSPEAPEDFGRGAVTGNVNDRYRFRTPPLRNVALTAPYFHDGAFVTLAGAVRHYDNPPASLANYNQNQLDPRLVGTFLNSGAVIAAISAGIDPRVRNINLNNQEVADLVAFLQSLTDPRFVDMSGLRPDRVPSGLPVD
ncbi:MAG: c-type cytochrome [Armatimonadetes bacterium]|nr:c-type cytochrome [Armatimonadota bacterium]